MIPDNRKMFDYSLPIIGSSVKADDCIFTAEIHSLEEEPIIRIQEANKKDVLVPAHLFDIFLSAYKSDQINLIKARPRSYSSMGSYNSYDDKTLEVTKIDKMLAEIRETFLAARRDINAPIKLIKRELSLIPGEPLLSLAWAKRKSLSEEEWGWELTFQGLSDVSLGFANWNDPEGILRLAESLDKPKDLMISLALGNSVKAKEFTNMRAFENALSQHLWPTINKTEVETILKKNQLLSPNEEKYYYEKPIYSLAIRNDALAMRITPIAERIPAIRKRRVPLQLDHMFKFSKASKEALSEKDRKKEEKIKEEWLVQVKQCLELPKNGGWREVKVDGKSAISGLWVTKIPEALWSSYIEPILSKTSFLESESRSRWSFQ